jgi:hypothetical protein
MTSERPDPKTQVESAQATYNIAHDDNPDPTNVEGRLPQQIARREIKRVVIKISGSNELLEMEGDDVDLGTDLKIRYHHQLVAEFRRDAVDGWWYKSFVLNDGPPYGGEGNATDVGDLADGASS